MKKVMFQCVGNVVLFGLFGGTFLHPFSEISRLSEHGIRGTISVIPILFALYLVAYPILYYILKKRLKWDKGQDSELSFADERERVIVSEAAKTAYQVLIGGLVVIIAIIGGVRFFTLFTLMEISMYTTSVLLLTVLLVVSTISYGTRWVVEYYK